MTQIQIDAGTLTANADERSVTGLLVPYGEECRSNLGRFSVSTGAFSIPDASIVGLNVEHVREDGIGRATAVRETPEGIVATFSVAPGPEGDAALVDVQSGKRKHLSAEVANVQIKDGKAVGGRLFGGALVERPAFPSATLLAAAEDTEDVEPLATDDPEAETTEESTTGPDGSVTTKVTTTKTETDADGTVTTTETVTTVTTEVPADEQPNDTQEEDEMGAAQVPNTLNASATTDKPYTKADAFGAFAGLAAGTVNGAQVEALSKQTQKAGTLFAALTDVKYDATGGPANAITVPQWIGELWDGVTYNQKFTPLFGHADLTGIKINGFRWTVKPEGGTYAGNKAAIPSNPVAAEPYETTAQRFAGGNDIDRAYVDFPDAGFFESYFQGMTESYAKWVDETVVFAGIEANATSLVADNPANLTIGSAMSALIDGAVEVISNNAIPSFAVLGTADYKQLLKTPVSDILGYLNASLGLSEGTLENAGFRITSSPLVTGGVYVGAREAATVYELGGGAPIRVEAPDIAKGGTDAAVFGYAGLVVHKSDALVKVTPYTSGS